MVLLLYIISPKNIGLIKIKILQFLMPKKLKFF
jgi:hypothetical protein